MFYQGCLHMLELHAPYLNLLVRPSIEIHRLYFANVSTHGSVEARASDADENATDKIMSERHN